MSDTNILKHKQIPGYLISKPTQYTTSKTFAALEFIKNTKTNSNNNIINDKIIYEINIVFTNNNIQETL